MDGRDRVCAAFLAVAILTPSFRPAHAQTADEGQALAVRWCASCHLIDRAARSGADPAPPFRALANDPAYTPTRLKGWLADPHPPMPNLNLTRREIDALTAYIRSLKD
jgi:mono/diheme cytochrome c family protein